MHEPRRAVEQQHARSGERRIRAEQRRRDREPAHDHCRIARSRADSDSWIGPFCPG